RAYVAQNVTELCQRLSESASVASCLDLKVNEPVCLFSNHAASIIEWATQLKADEPIFGRWLDTCTDKVQAVLGVDLRQHWKEDAISRVSGTMIEKILLFCSQVALAQTWIAWGLKPAAVIGEGVGE